MDPAQLIQVVLTAAATQAQLNSTVQVTDGGTSASTAASSSSSSFLNFSALHNWLKLIIVGAAIETSRRMFFYLWRSLTSSFWITARFDEHDISYGERRQTSSILSDR